MNELYLLAENIIRHNFKVCLFQELATYGAVQLLRNALVDQRLLYTLYRPTHEQNFIVENGHDVFWVGPGTQKYNSISLHSLEGT